MNIPVNIKYYGKNDELPQQRLLNAGSLNVVYEDGNLRYIDCNGTEIIRMIYAAVRDRAWLTAAPEITDEIIEIKSDSFHISYNCRYKLNDIDFSAGYNIDGHANGHITFEMKGKALSTFLRNRIGFCILHPVTGCAGVDCRIVHSDGSVEIKPFPKYIDPGIPFKNIQSMNWNIEEGLQTTLNFHGDVFETEDHRNWTDASFKTYCTPLDTPYPVLIEEGTVICQKIELIITGSVANEKSMKSKIEISLHPDEKRPLPSLGIGKSTRDSALSDTDVALLEKLHFGHYRTDIYFHKTNWKEVYMSAAEESKKLNSPLELALFFGEEPKKEVELFFSLYSEVYSVIKSIFIFHNEIKVTTNELVEAVAGIIRQNIPGSKIFAGTNCNFAQLNRSRTNNALIDGFVFAIHPQEHASDNLTIVENLQAQAYAVESAKQFAGGKEIAISPVTIQRRFNANIENFEAPSLGDRMPWQVDERQMSLFAAAWTAASFKYIAQSGASSVTFYETTGERGILMGEKSSRWPEYYYAAKDTLFPMFHVLAFIAQFKDAEIINSISSDPLRVDSLVIKRKNNLQVILFNLTHLPESVYLSGHKQPTKVLHLNETSFSNAIKNSEWLTDSNWEELNPSPEGLEITILPYGCVFIKTI
ncbi:MAG: hypothetical protein M0Q53_18835 [Prolixibacteraceae bacterium]|jgi:hypothetical protein|nr:hypothetical protein [Prolixibacteraceae bacterium]